LTIPISRRCLQQMRAGECFARRVKRARALESWACVTRLIDTEFSASWECDLCEQSPTEILHGSARNVVVRHFRNERFDVIAHEIELVNIVLLRRMDGKFSRRQAENEPPMPDIHAGKFQNVSQESTIGFGIGAVDNRMRAVDHRL